MDLKALYQKYASVFRPILYTKNRLLSLRIRGISGNRVLGIDRCLMKHCRITFAGTGSTVEIGDMSTLQDVQINICGSGNRVVLGDRVSLLGCTFSIEDDNNEINSAATASSAPAPWSPAAPKPWRAPFSPEIPPSPSAGTSPGTGSASPRNNPIRCKL